MESTAARRGAEAYCVSDHDDDHDDASNDVDDDDDNDENNNEEKQLPGEHSILESDKRVKSSAAKLVYMEARCLSVKRKV